MRAHGIVADDSPTPSNILDDDDPDPDPDPDPHNPHPHPHHHHHHHPPPHSWDHHHNKPINRRMYALRTNPNRLKTCRVCENCGKEFVSWKSFLEHGKCTTSDDLDDSLLSSPPCSDDDDEDEDECTATPRRPSGSNNNNWSKRKRSLRVKVGSPASNEEEDLANCLMMLSNGRVVEPMLVEGEAEAEAEAEESCASASKDDHHLLLQQQQDHNHHRNYNYNNNNNIRKPINFIPPLSYRLPDTEEDNNNNKPKGTVGGGKGMFECKACKKVFNSHQALGGHRASHKKVKGCFAARLDHMDLDARENDDVYEDSLFPTKPNHNSSSSAFHYENPMGSASKRKTKVHECSICHRIFSSGQALGGHKRCHWITSNAAAAAAAAAAEAPKFHEKRVVAPPANFDSITANSQVILPLDLKLDLNLPAPAEEVRRSAFEVSTEIHLQSWVCKNDKVEENECEEEEQKQGKENKTMMKKEEENKNSNIVNNEDVEEEAESKVKLAKLSELKDMNMSAGNSSPWLQVGIASTTHDVTPDP